MLLAFQQEALDKSLNLNLLKRHFIKSRVKTKRSEKRCNGERWVFFTYKNTKSPPEIKDFCVRVQNCCTDLAPRTGLEPVTSPTVSDSQARANIVGATRQSHSRLRRSHTHFRYSLLLPLTRKNSRSGYFFESTTNFAAP